MPLLAEVAIPVPLARAFSYEVPAKLAPTIRPGARVLCGFRGRKLVGVVLSVEEREPPPDAPRLKPILALLDAEPILSAELLSFLQVLGSYYFAPIGEVVRLALPAVEREQVRDLKVEGELFAVSGVEGARQVGGRKIAFACPTDAIEAPGTLRGQASAVLALLRAGGEQPVARLEARFGNARAAVKKLASLGLCVIEDREAPRDPFFATPEARDAPPDLNEPQAHAAARIEAALIEAAAPTASTASTAPTASGIHAFLLFGVTGSGKTEVYLRAIAACVASGRGALMMVPEIALTPQLISRFRARFGDGLAVLHSGLSDRDRHAMWSKLRDGVVRVAIGARSALFAPVPDLGLVIVDEEHDGSFKQEEGVRYQARDMAILRAHRARAVAVLGSATPSLESIALVRRNKLEALHLPDRAHREATLPVVSIVDLKRIGPGPTGDRLLSIPLHRALEATLAAKEQSILFLNRRGFAPSVVCEGCGVVETCRSCSVALTYHRGAGGVGRLRCHYCDFDGPLAGRCTSCGDERLSLEGLGTERLEATVATAFPGARVARLDRDVAAGAKSQKILNRMRAGEIDILVGTQMVTKGHDLPNVTLVGVVNADSALSMPDFRASERGFQLLVQVAGRAGRHERPGRVLIQTYNPEHAAIRFAAHHDVSGFLEHELEDRREAGYPPFFRLALVRIDAQDEQVARDTAALLAARAKTSPEVLGRRVDVLGPSVAPIARLRGRFRFRVMLRAVDRRALRVVLAIVDVAREEADRRARIALDVDPVAML